MRNMLFISHANPEDNEFSRWLALQLAKEGYPVWCDLTKLLGGEDFWKDIEKAIRERTVKFIYVLSRTSNRKDGPLQELHVAHNVARDLNLKDFIIPLLIDDLPHREINIQLSRLTAIPFNKGWAHGLDILLEKLRQENIQKNSAFNPSAVASWWRGQFGGELGIFENPDEYLSNWFPIKSLPNQIFFHKLRRNGIGLIEVPDDLPFPGVQHELYLISFAKADDFKGKLGHFIEIEDSTAAPPDVFINGGYDQFDIDKKQTRDLVFRLFKMAWERHLIYRELPLYELSNGVKCFYFRKGAVEKDEIHFMGVGGKQTYRAVVGIKTVSENKVRYWHFGIQAKPLIYPYLAFIVKPHVLFSDDGENIWESKDKLHSARRSQCKMWWNPEWRDRILAVMTWLSNQDGLINIQLGSEAILQVSNTSIMFNSPVSYSDPEDARVPDDEIDEDEEDGIEDELGDIEDKDEE